MSTNSYFIANSGHISVPKRRFEKWLRKCGYEACSDAFPAAIHATTLIDEYFNEYPERIVERITIEEHAEEIGWISDYTEDDENDD